MAAKSVSEQWLAFLYADCHIAVFTESLPPAIVNNIMLYGTDKSKYDNDHAYSS